jgi:hypothetical protein
MAVPNVNEITTTLRMLSDEQLRKYAQMHKGDPYILPMAISESNARKQLRAAGQATQGAQPQPKVADQAIAQMSPQQLPENVGIGALPAPNMQFAAEGGIMGYEGYDEGESTYGQEPVIRMAGGGAVERYQFGGSIADKYKQESMEMGMGARVQYSPDVQEYARAQSQPSEEEQQAFRDEQQRMLEGGRFRPFPDLPRADERRAAKSEAASAAKVTPTFSKDDYSGMDRRIMSGSQLPSVPSISPPAKAAPTKERGAAPRPGTGAGPAAAAATPEQSVTDRYAAMQKAMGLTDTSKVDAERQALYDAMRAQDKSALEEFEKDVAARGKYGEAKEARLAKREAELGKRKDETAGLAMLEAGLAIMSTPGGLATAIGKGAQTGLKTYSAGLKDLRAAQEKMDDARDQIEEFRRNEANMTAKERRQFKNQIGRTETDIKRLGLDAAEKMTGEKRADLRTLFTADQQILTTGMEIKGRKEAAQIAAGPGYERNKLLREAQGQEAKVRAEYGKMQAKVMDTLSKDQDYMMAPPEKKQLMQTTALRQALMNNPFLASYASGIGFSSAPAGGKVYDLTED